MCEGDRLIALQGLYGDGKDTIAKACLRFLADRKVYTGGVIYLNLQRITSSKVFLQKLKQVILMKLGWKNDRIPSHSSHTFEDDMTQFLINFFNQSGGS